MLQERDAPSSDAEGLLAPSTPAAVEIEGSVDDSDDLDADIAALAETAAGGSEFAEPEVDPLAGREIVYRVTPTGLIIEIDGIHLKPKAKPFKKKNGAYGVKLTLEARSFDGRQYWLKTPAEGPMSIAGSIQDKKGKKSRFADRRRGDDEQPVIDGEPVRLRQSWPGKGQPKLWWGQTVTLEVGLWGLRAEDGRERPVSKLFVVKMLAGHKPQAVVSPPTLDWGS